MLAILSGALFGCQTGEPVTEIPDGSISFHPTSRDGGTQIKVDCSTAADSAACDDGDRFTVGDRCTARECKGTALSLEVAEAFVEVSPGRTSFLAPAEQMVVVARLNGSPEHEAALEWKVTARGRHTGPAKILTGRGQRLVFQGTSKLGNSGSRRPNPPLEYDVVALLNLDGRNFEANLPADVLLRQSEVETLRQEYVDYDTRFRPGPLHVVPVSRPLFNTGNYSLIVEEQPDALERMFNGINHHATRLVNNDVQVHPVGKRGLSRTTVVVDPGPSGYNTGALGDTDPTGDDECAQPKVDGRCKAAILAGPNGVVETPANNRRVKIDIDRFITSAFRNPQRNRAAGSVTRNSLHTRGLALDIDPRAMAIPGKSSTDMMCILEQAGDLAVAPDGKSFTERGAATYLECDDPIADHVHVNF